QPAHAISPVARLEIGPAGATVALDRHVVAVDVLLDEEPLALAHAAEAVVDRIAAFVRRQIAEHDLRIAGEQVDDVGIAAVIERRVIGVAKRADLLEVLEAADASFERGKVGHEAAPSMIVEEAVCNARPPASATNSVARIATPWGTAV